MTDAYDHSEPACGRRGRGAATQLRGVIIAAARSLTRLPGKLLALAIVFVMIAEVLVFFPSVSNFRTAWLEERAQEAHLAALAAEAAGDRGVGDEVAAELLAGVGAVLVARTTPMGTQEVLRGSPEAVDRFMAGRQVDADLRETSLWRNLYQVCEAFFAGDERYLRITARPETRPDETIMVIMPEAPLRAELIGFAYRIFWLSVIIAAITGLSIYACLFFILVRPMRRLAESMMAFQEDPADPSRTVRLSGRRDEIGEAQNALAAMQADVRQALRQRERLAALGEAVAKINHDLRNVLAAAQLASDRLAMSKDERVAAMGQRLVRAVDRGVRLCQDVLEYGRAQERPPEIRPVPLAAALDEAASDAFDSVGQAGWENRVAADLYAAADPDHLHRIFLNLMRNALQAMAGGNRRELRVEAFVDEETVRVALADTGAGVPETARAGLFQPFSATTRKGGSGLGLSIAKELVEALGGSVRLAETGPDGSVFEVALPKA